MDHYKSCHAHYLNLIMTITSVMNQLRGRYLFSNDLGTTNNLTMTMEVIYKTNCGVFSNYIIKMSFFLYFWNVSQEGIFLGLF